MDKSAVYLNPGLRGMDKTRILGNKKSSERKNPPGAFIRGAIQLPPKKTDLK